MFHVKIITTEKVDMTGTFLFKLVYSQFTIFSPPQSSLLQPPDTATLAVMSAFAASANHDQPTYRCRLRLWSALFTVHSVIFSITTSIMINMGYNKTQCINPSDRIIQVGFVLPYCTPGCKSSDQQQRLEVLRLLAKCRESATGSLPLA